jgi:hypothetical protein
MMLVCYTTHYSSIICIYDTMHCNYSNAIICATCLMGTLELIKKITIDIVKNLECTYVDILKKGIATWK